jgi:D-alanyl-D-alanine dipeptidase/carboxypeptidase
MKTLQLTQKDIYQGSLILVTKQHPLHKDHVDHVQGLVSVDEQHRDIFLVARPAAMLYQLIASCNAQDAIIPISGYRSFQEQQQIFDDSMRDNGTGFTLQFVALPNCSEHQTGLAIDVAEQKEHIDFICPDFPYSGICQEFRIKAADFGFIERYPQGKEQITGISHKPWHFRYVDHPHSKIIQSLALTLEEYISLLSEHPYQIDPLLFQKDGSIMKISYINLSNDRSVSFPVPTGQWHISGNNVDGVIITEWT